MNLQTIKDTYAQEQDCKDWDELANSIQDDLEYEQHWTEICLRVQKAALEKQKEDFISEITNRADSLYKVSLTKKGKEKIPFEGAVTCFTVFKMHIKRSITNPENLIQ